MRVILCDDERLARMRLQSMLERLSAIDSVEACATSGEALALLRTQRYDALFLDVEMPELDGFDLLDELARLKIPVPPVVLVTAHSRYALQAFDTMAIDFLEKPVRIARLERSLERVRRELLIRTAGGEGGEGALSAAPSFSWVRHRGERIRLDLGGADWVEAEREYVRLHYGAQSHLIRMSLSALHDRAPESYMRIHRSYAVKRGTIIGCRRTTAGKLMVRVTGGVELPVSRSYRPQISAVLANKAG